MNLTQFLQNLSTQNVQLWQTQILGGSQGEGLWKYWQQQLAGELPLLNLLIDRPRPSVQTYQGASHTFKLSKELVQKLKELAKVERVTLYMILIAAFGVLLHRYMGQSDILVGSPTTGRSKTEFANIVGYFVNPVVLRANFLGNPTLKAFLAQIRSTVLGVSAHQDYPFPLLVKQLQSNRDPSYSPIFQVSFAFQKPQQDEVVDLLNNSEIGTPMNWGGLLLEPFEIAQQEGLFDLTLDMIETKESLKSVFKYNIDLFDAATIERMAGHFQTLLEGIVGNPIGPVSQLPLLSEVEQRQLLVEWNETTVKYPFDKRIHQLFEEQAQRTPDAVAVVYENQQLTYQQLNCRANQLAHYLQSLGVGPEVLVGICVERSLDMVVGLLGILKAGGAYVPLDPEYPQERLSFMLEDAAVSARLTQQHLVEKLPEHRAQLVCLYELWEQIAQNYQDNPISGVRAFHLANVIYTSGSTGRPKGVMATHAGLCNLAQAQIQTFGVQNSSRILQFASLSFDASIWEVMMAVGSGATLYLGTKDSLLPGMPLIQLLRDYCITHITLPPSALAVLPFEELPTQQTMIVAGEACFPELITKWSAGRNFFNAYGPTEATVCATVAKCTDGDRSAPIGHPIANTQVYILDSHLQPVPIGVPGELNIGAS